MNWLVWLVRGWLMQSASSVAMDAVREATRSQNGQPSNQASDNSAGKPAAAAEDDEEDSVAPVSVVIVAALNIEIAPLLAKLEKTKKVTGGDFVFHGGFWKGQRIAIVESGVGLARAKRATHAAIDAFQPQWIISAGFAGGLDPQIPRGSIVAATSVKLFDSQEPLIALGLGMSPDPASRLFTGPVVTVPKIVRTIQEKQVVFGSTQALAAEMETWGVADVCRTRKCRMLAIRVISDDAKTTLPAEILTVAGPTGSVRAGALLGAILNRPGSVSDLWKLREEAHQSAERLSRFLESMLPTLLAKAD